MSAVVKTINKPALSVKAQALWTAGALAGAVVFPQLFHALGAVSGLGTALGEAFLPMHLPIILAGFLGGPVAGCLGGLFGPLLSFALSGMPTAAMLPFMMLELCLYGLSAGLLRNIKMPSLLKLLAVQLSGRLVRAAAILIAVYLFGFNEISPAVILTSVKTGLFGLCLQWALIPLITYRIENIKKHEQ